MNALRKALLATALALSGCASSRSAQQGEVQEAALRSENQQLEQGLRAKREQAKQLFNDATAAEGPPAVAGLSCAHLASPSGPNVPGSATHASLKLHRMHVLVPRLAAPQQRGGVRVTQGSCEVAAR